MLRAHLEHKLGKVIARALTEADTVGQVEISWRSKLHGDEDTLTSSVFERLSYLDPQIAWDVLRCACGASGTDRFPGFPGGEQEWRFWPSLSPAEKDRNERFVEPDILLLVPGYAVILESKHRSAQYSDQWVSQVRAARLAHPTRQVLHIAVGGSSQLQHQEGTKLAQETLAHHSEAQGAFYYLSWRQLGAELSALTQPDRTHAGQRRLVQAVLQALAAWGYRRRLWLHSLPVLSTKLSSSALATWKPVVHRPRTLGLAHLPLNRITRTPPALLQWRVRCPTSK